MGRLRHLESGLLLCHAVEADVTQRLARHEASLEWKLLQCASMWWIDRRERDKQQFERL